MRSKPILVGGIFTFAIVAVLIWSPWLAVPTLGTQLKKLGFTELCLPSTRTPPGAIIAVLAEDPLSGEVVCGAESALGAQVSSRYTISDSLSIKASDQLRGSLELNLDDIAHETSIQIVKNVSVVLDNVKVLSLSDATVFELAPMRSQSCRDAIAARFDDQQKVTMIQAVIQADATYKIEFKQLADSSTKVSTTRELGARLHATAGRQTVEELVGENLFWAVRDNQRLAAYDGKLPPTGSTAALRILPSNGRIRLVEAEPIVRLDVSPLRQPSAMSCWATVTTMMMNWNDGNSRSIDDVVSSFGEPWKTFFELDTGLPPEKHLEFAQVANLVAEQPRNFSIAAYAEMLDDFGPIWITTTGEGFSSHARLLVGVFGDGSPTGTSMEFIDPASGTAKRVSFGDFIAAYEKEPIVIARIDKSGRDVPFRYQVLHSRADNRQNEKTENSKIPTGMYE